MLGFKEEEIENMNITKLYRVHYTCPAGHTGFEDYKTRRAAMMRFDGMQDKTDWYATRQEVIKCNISLQV